jgi:hypothetical protein
MCKRHGEASIIHYNQGSNKSKKRIMKIFIKLFIAALVCLTLTQTTVLASSHREAPLIAYDPLADNTDVYAFRSPVDTNKVVLIADYIPFELPQGGPNYYNFGENIRYEIHVKNSIGTTGDDITYRFTFNVIDEDSSTFFNIRLNKQNLKTTYTLERGIHGTFTSIISNGAVPPNNIGPRSIENATVGLGMMYESLAANTITTASTGERVFCGPRDDPFFVDLGGIFDVGNFRVPGRDGLAKFNVHSIAIEVPISILQKDGMSASQASSILDPAFVIGVWASASRPAMSTFDTTGGAAITTGNFIQVSRLGMPLTNEAVIPIGQKDSWNSVITNTANEGNYIPFFNNPELALYMDDSKFGGAVPGLSALRIQSNSLGAYDFRNGHRGLYDLKGSAAVAGTALDNANFGTILLPDSVSPRAVDLLPIFYTGVPNLIPYQLATGKNGNPLAAGKPFINNFLPTLGDMLRLNMAVPVTPRNDPKFSSLGLVQAAVLGLTDTLYNKDASLQFIPNMDGFPNGRRLEDDVTTIELQAVSGVVLAAIGLWYDDYIPGTSPSPVTPQLVNVLGFNAGVTTNDTTFRSDFPFVQTPWRGFIGASYSGTLVSLPVNWVSFVAEKDDRQVNLRWHVANEINNIYYAIEYSPNGVKYSEIGKVKATSSARGTYEFVHATPLLNSTNYYRIKQVDNDGKFTYSVVRTVRFDSQNAISVLPNPASDFIRVYSKQPGSMVNLFDINGRKLISKIVTNGMAEFSISRFAKGTYLVTVEINGVRIETKKIIKQ